MGSAEFQLVVHCCRLAFDGAVAPSSTPRGPLDWQRFDRLVRFHRVQGLIWKSLPRLGNLVPPNVARTIAEDAARIATANRASLAECQTLADALEHGGIDCLFLKGLPLGVLAYGAPWIKAGVDIDLLIDSARLDAALPVLRACGFRREDDRPEEVGALRAWHRFRKDSEWWKPGSSARVDLHTRLTDNPALIPTVGIGSPRQSVEITADCSIPTLASDELFAHLCVHGASSAWFRLKWITDLAALLHPKSTAEIVRLYRRSQELGAGRAAGQALLLADGLYETLAQCPDLRDSLASDGCTRWLYQAARRQLAGRPEPVEPTARPGGTLRIHLTQFLLLPGVAFKASELIRQARAAAG